MTERVSVGRAPSDAFDLRDRSRPTSAPSEDEDIALSNLSGPRVVSRRAGRSCVAARVSVRVARASPSQHARPSRVVWAQAWPFLELVPTLEGARSASRRRRRIRVRRSSGSHPQIHPRFISHGPRRRVTRDRPRHPAPPPRASALSPARGSRRATDRAPGRASRAGARRTPLASECSGPSAATGA